jgi:D-lactate dehydrogenase
MKTLVYSTHGFEKSFLVKAANHKHELKFTSKHLNETTASMAKGFEAITLFSSDNASEKVLGKLHEFGVKFVALRSVGYDHVDLEKAKQLGIIVANVPSYSPYAIAEHAVSLILALNRKIILSQELMRQNDFRLDKLIGFDLHGKTVGIVGTGRIGSAFASIMHGFGCKLLGFDIEENPVLIEKTNISYTSLDALCKTADIISVCCPLNSSTKYLFDKHTFRKMKKGVVFINTGRGGVVNSIDLLEALDSSSVAYAGLDVYEYEKPIFFDDHTGEEIEDKLFLKLRRHPKVLLTGHQAFLTNEELSGIAETTIKNLSSWALNGSSENDLN